MNLLPVVDRVNQEIDKSIKAKRYRTDPALWAKEYLGMDLWSKQRDIAESVRDNHNTAVAAAHGVGKSHVASVIACWWVDVHPPSETFVATTAPSVDQLSIIWDGIRKVHALAQRRYEEGLVDHPLPGKILGVSEWKMPDGTLIGQGRKPPDDKSDVAFQGRHATYLLAIGDEAVGLSGGFLEALGNIATADLNRVLLLANPTDPSCAMAKLWDEKITHWNRMHISAFDSPAITNEEGFDITKAPALTGWGYINDRKSEWGEDDPRYIARVLGQWAFDAGNTVFTAQELASAKNTVVLPYEDEIPQTGWDIARMGGDFSVGYTMERGTVWETDDQGNRIRETDREGYRIRLASKWQKAPLVGQDPNNPGSATRIFDWCAGEGVDIVKVDASGIGSAVVDGLADLDEHDRMLVVEVFGGAASADPRAYRNLRAEMFFKLKEDMLNGRLDLDAADTTLFDELEGIRFEYTERNALKIESKDAIRKAGRKSPDHADAVWYARLPVDSLLDPMAALPAGSRVALDLEDEYVYGAEGTPL